MSGQLFSVGLPLVFVWLCLAFTFWALGLLPWKPAGRLGEWIEERSAFELRDLGELSTTRLLLISAVSLFLELLLIRWLSSEVRIFAFFKNLVLVGCFFGFGLGCYLSRKKIRLTYILLPLIVLVLLTSLPWADLQRLLLKLSNYIGGLADVHVFGRHYGSGLRLYAGAAMAFSVVIPLLTLATVSMVPMGQLVSRFLEERAGISAYSANVAASIVGIWLFTGLSFLSTPPVVWFLVFGLGLLAMTWRLARFRAGIIISFVVIGALFWSDTFIKLYDPKETYDASQPIHYSQVAEERTYWSPYQKLNLVTLTKESEVVRYILETNGSWYQEIMSLRPDWVEKHPEYINPQDRVPLPYHRYNMPYRFKPEPDSVLILGAGMGNDVAAALRNGAKRVVAVEIDPLIEELGSEKHLEKPYSDPRVVAVINDARAYVQNSPERFDLIVSSILDSQTTQSSFTNIRTDNYVYTQEGLAAIQRLLKPGGVMSIAFSSERRWFGGRIKTLLTMNNNGTPPLSMMNDYFFFLVGDGVQQRLEQDQELRAFVNERKDPPIQDAANTTDDWPYFYHRYRGIPMIVLLLSALVILLCAIVLRGNELRLRNLQWHFFFLGAGFMLMEVQIISKLALVFGTTWLVNSIAISALLALILLANAVAARFPALTGGVAYAGLFMTLALCYFVPLRSLLFESFWQRAIASTLVLCSPVFFAGLIFISSFAQSKFQAVAFGSNLFGSVVGGLLEALSFWTGIRALLVVAALCYLFSLMTRRGTAPVSVPVGAPAVAGGGD